MLPVKGEVLLHNFVAVHESAYGPQAYMPVSRVRVRFQGSSGHGMRAGWGVGFDPIRGFIGTEPRLSRRPGWLRGRDCGQGNNVGWRNLPRKDLMQTSVPSLQRLAFAFDKVGPDVVPNERSDFLAPSLVTEDSGNDLI